MATVLFSQRYFKALEKNQFQVEIPDAARRKLWAWLNANNSSFYYQPDPNDNWNERTSILEQTAEKLHVEHGWEIPLDERGIRVQDWYRKTLREIVETGDGKYVLDIVELACQEMNGDECEALRQKTNQIFDMHECPWRIVNGEFFKLDADFMGARLAGTAHDALAANGFTGAADEYAKARQYLATDAIKEAIINANNSFESVMKVLTGQSHLNADKLIKALQNQGYLDDLPDSVRSSFGEQVLKALPSLRNRLGGHGQGAEVISVPKIYGELAVQLAAAFHNFLIAKHIERQPPKGPQKEKADDLDSTIPF